MAGAITSSLGVDVSGVRVHQASRQAALLGARAFAHGRDVFLGAGEHAEDLALIAHEVAHVVQQHAAPRVMRFTRGTVNRFEHEAHRAAAAVVTGRQFTVAERTAPRVQRFGISDVLDYLADKAYLIPGFRMFTIVLGVNPVNMSRVERNAANVLRAVIEFIPGGALITQALDNYGVFERVGAWVDEQIASLGMTGRMIRDALDEFLDSLHWSDLLHPGDVWDRAKEIFSRPIHRIIDFLGGLVTGIVRFIKDAILRPLAGLASQTRGWDLLKAVLGRDPITGDEVPRNAETLIGGFMKLIGQEEVWNNLRQARAVERAWAWFQGALEGLLGFVRQIPSLFISALQDLEIADIVLLPRAFIKVGRVFGRFALDFFSWAGRQVLSLLQIIFEVVAPGAMPYIRKAGGAIQTIFRDPIRFIGLLVRAGIQGFRQFGSNFLTHLRNSLIQWLTGTLSGANIYIPQAFELREIIKFVLSVLGLTWQNVRSKLVRLIPEPVVTALETGFDIVVTLVRDGPAAAWDKIREQITNLREMVMEQVMTFVRERIVQAAITRLLTSLNPAGAFIQAVIAIYNTVMFFVERLRQIQQVAMSFIDAISTIAAGAIGPAANRVEQTMAGLLTLVISFLARLVGLGNVSDQVISVVNRIRAPIDRALDRVVEWIVATARRLGRLVVGAARSAAQRVAGWWTGIRESFADENQASHSLYFDSASPRVIVASNPEEVGVFLTRRAAEISAGSSPDKARKLAAVASARAIIQTINNLVGTTAATGAAPADTRPYEQQMRGLMVDLRNHVREVGYSGDPPVQPFTVVPAFSGSKATGIHMEGFLFGASPGGEEASAYSGTLQGALPMLTGWGVRRRWVAYHLLNNHLGGRALDSNLIPVHRDDNLDYSRNFEERVKGLAGAGSASTTPRPVWMTVHIAPLDDRFYRNIAAEGGAMEPISNRWRPTSRAAFTYSRNLKPPDRRAIAINALRSIPQAARGAVLSDVGAMNSTINYLLAATSNPITSLTNIIYLINQHPDWSDRSKRDRIREVQGAQWIFDV